MQKKDKNKDVEKFLSNNYRKIEALLEKEQYNHAMMLIRGMAKLQYEFNQEYVDYRLEEFLKKISSHIEVERFTNEANSIVFFDGFGVGNRGLAKIYIEALCKRYKITYITYEDNSENTKKMLEGINTSNIYPFFLKGRSLYEKSRELVTRVTKTNSSHLFMYIPPWDVVANVAFFSLENLIDRIQINLTDHAFWLGAACTDKCIEFREYGAYISTHYRMVETIYMLPLSPGKISKTEFEGFPFDVSNKKVIFSGGALYKTIGAGGSYYKFIEYILETYLDTVFWYAGDDSIYRTELDRLAEMFPGRVYFTRERNDLMEILKRTFLYVNTYPIGGGLLVQYAVLAGTIPLLVKYDDNSSGVLINQERLPNVFDDFESARSFVDKIMQDDNYRMSIINEISDSVISIDEFESTLYGIIENGEKQVESLNINVDMTTQKKVYYDRFDSKILERFIIQKDVLISAFMQEPWMMIKGIIGEIIRKWKSLNCL